MSDSNEKWRSSASRQAARGVNRPLDDLGKVRFRAGGCLIFRSGGLRETSANAEKNGFGTTLQRHRSVVALRLSASLVGVPTPDRLRCFDLRTVSAPGKQIGFKLRPRCRLGQPPIHPGIPNEITLWRIRHWPVAQVLAEGFRHFGAHAQPAHVARGRSGEDPIPTGPPPLKPPVFKNPFIRQSK